jgi:hypothetical protein
MESQAAGSDYGSFIDHYFSAADRQNPEVKYMQFFLPLSPEEVDVLLQFGCLSLLMLVWHFVGGPI